MAAGSNRVNVILDEEHAVKLRRLAERTHTNPGTIARSLLATALDEADPDPRDVVAVIDLARATYRKMVQNLAWATGYNVIAIPLAAGVLSGVGIVLSPAVGAALMSLSTVIVAVNARTLGRM